MKTSGINWNATLYCYLMMENLEERNAYFKHTAKIIMQQIWLDDIGWDDLFKQLIFLKWRNFVSNSKGIDEIELHEFCDSSVLYSRV